MNQFISILSKNKPGLLIGLGIGSLIMGTVAAIHTAPIAKDALEEKKKELQMDRLPAVETIKTAGPYLVPTLLFTSAGVACILGGNKMNLNRGAAAMAAYALSESTLQAYREKTREIVGEKKEKDIRESVAKDVMEKNPVGTNAIILTGSGNSLCFDEVTKQHFRSDKNKIESIINKLNYYMYSNSPKISLNEYCDALRIDHVLLGDELGWDINDNGYIDINITAVVAETGEPCLVINHVTKPKAIHGI